MKDFLFKNNLPVKQCAGDLGISVSYLYQLLKKERKPSLSLALKIEQYTQGEVSVSDLLETSPLTPPKNLPNSLDQLIETKLRSIHQSLENLDKRLTRLENL